jgi:hypothetical protein
MLFLISTILQMLFICVFVIVSISVLRSRRAGKLVVDSFLGSQLVDWLMAVELLCSRDDAVCVANEVSKEQNNKTTNQLDSNKTRQDGFARTNQARDLARHQINC